MRFLICLTLAANLAWVPLAGARELVIGSIADEPAKEIAVFQPLADYLAVSLKDRGIERGRVTVAKDLAEMIDLLRERKVDLYIDSPFPSLVVSERADTQLRLRCWKGGRAEYHSVILVHRDSGIAGLEDLAGKTVAVEDSYSTSGYLLPKLALVQGGLRPRQVHGVTHRVRPREVGYLFAREMENMVALLLRKRVAATGVGIHELDTLRPWEREQLTVIYRTRPVPRHVVSIRASLEQHLADRICDILKGMEGSEQGRHVLAHFERTTRFDDVPDQARKTLAELRALVRAELNGMTQY